MAQRLRLYFGSGRSNTAPEILETDAEEQLEDSEVVGAHCMHPPPLLRPSQESTAQHVPSTTFGLPPEPSLKRSSSMFIPQLATCSESRPTKSSSMHISLQRSNGLSNREAGGHADDLPPPCYTPPGPAPAYMEPHTQADFPLQPPPPYYSSDSLKSSSFLTEPNLPKLRVFSIGSNGHAAFRGGHSGVSVGAICIRRNSLDGSDTQHFKVFPYGGDVRSSQQQILNTRSFGVNGAPQRLVFQLQQKQNQDPIEDRREPPLPQEECINLNHGSMRSDPAVRYPRIRLQRSSSHQRLLLESNHKKNGADFQTIQENQTDADLEVKNGSNCCTFKISGESPRRQPHFKIYFTQGGDGDQDVTAGSELTTNNSKVKTISKFCETVFFLPFFFVKALEEI